MTDFSVATIATTESAEEVHDDSFKTIVMVCCTGLLASLCLMTFGIDLGSAWI